ncbi:hypothetical protein RQM47_14035 [Rubrivirga sp. S365]|uniref:Uncharacterized protein n=1 Tax=Rubrivirga litoralis TaxID=3075598 RepID=A0ABU3BV40_9BACT|nr:MULTISPECIES: hypothetical protein [unclassified Rubrivirga]MDT0633159.1 hypothetical protein [Rubrivirga sp. F394]MDT7857766.1 hypothetical protein [Rubrivirga sp. S365]
MRALALALPLALAGCLPYSVGQTAETAPEGTLVVSQSAQFVPIDSPFGVSGGCEGDCPSDESGAGYMSLDAEVRVGVTERSDVGVRLVGGPGSA